MRYATFEFAGAPRLGIVQGDAVVDVTACHPALGHDMGALLAACAQQPAFAADTLRQARVQYALAEVRLLAPVLAPRKLIGVGMNYGSFMAAARRMNAPLPSQPVWFSRPLSAIAGPSQTIQAPRNSGALDYEGELAVVIGRRCRHITAAEARTVIGGYTVANDLTVRDWAAVSPQLGKSFDTHAPIGPWIMCPDELGDPHRLALQTFVNGTLCQDGNTADMLTDCYGLVAALSAVCTLEPGDIVLTGTPAGCAVLQSPPRYLQPGDCVRVEISGLGALVNAVVAEPA